MWERYMRVEVRKHCLWTTTTPSLAPDQHPMMAPHLTNHQQSTQSAQTLQSGEELRRAAEAMSVLGIFGMQ